MSTRVRRGTFSRTCRRCGWAATYDTPAKADHAKRRHSCARHQALAERKARGEKKRAAVDRTPQPCNHPVADHQHGTYACYTLDACRCLPCAAAVYTYESDRQRQHAYGRWDNFIDAEPAREHVRALMARGMGWERIARTADVTRSSVGSLLFGRPRPDGTRRPVSQRIRKDLAAALMSVELDLAPGARVDATGTRRRLRALVAIGYSGNVLGRELGTLNIHALITARRGEQTLRSTAEAVTALYDRLSMTPNRPEEWRERIAASRARGWARQNGWLSPLEWDDALIDDPAHQADAEQDSEVDLADYVDEMAVERRLSGDRTAALTQAERFEVVRRGRAAGWSYRDLETRAGINKPERYIEREAAS